MLDYTYVNDEDSSHELFYGAARVIWSVTVAAEATRRAFSVDDYQAQIAALLPRGDAWPRALESTLQQLLAALAGELARVDARSVDLENESDPRLTSELLPDWERVAGLPDACVQVPQTMQERRAALLARLTSSGGQSKAYYIELAARLGYGITIDEFKTEAAAITAGIPYTGTGWAHTWRVNAPQQSVRSFRVGRSAVGEPLRSWGNETLECALGHVKPAHTVLLFAYA